MEYHERYLKHIAVFYKDFITTRGAYSGFLFQYAVFIETGEAIQQFRFKNLDLSR